MFGFEKARNAFIPSRSYMPVGYGQLGCSGFIVVDAKGNFISRKTKAFLDYGEEAFQEVEDLVNKELRRYEKDDSSKNDKTNSDPPSTALPNSSRVKTANHIESIDCPPKVGVAAMDEEHEECTAALNAMLKNPSRKSLEETVQVLEKHFQHEEELLRRNGFGSVQDSFSPLFSH